jgi:beta-mannosidase
MPKITIDLNSSGATRRIWEFKGINTYRTMPREMQQAKRWMKASVPGTVHTDLMAAGIIPDPFYGMNENLVQWVDSQKWLYRRHFNVSMEMLQERYIELVAEGLDTFAEVRINRKTVAIIANMFITHRIGIKRYVHRGLNTIEIIFDSPTMHSKALEKLHGVLRVAQQSQRVYARKAQYSFNWDWGPTLATSGIWKSISLEAHSGPQLKHPFACVLSLHARMAVVQISVDIDHATRRTLKLRTSVGMEGWSDSTVVHVKGKKAMVRLHIPNPRVWWPNGYGDHPIYIARLSLLDEGKEVDSIEVPFAIRTVKLLQEKDDEGKTFIVEVNGVKIFCKGADWIPCDSFLPRIQDSTYERLLAYARDAHMNMIRVWGGGIYEQDIFYNLCDRLGLMVWQDFMFACGEYPQERWFLDQVKEEALSVVRRLRNHASIVVWCGNNECEWIFCTENPGRTPDDMNGARIFNDILPATCKEHDGTRPYWRSSPFGMGFPNGESDGTHHQWTVWSFWKDYKEYENDNARFVAEFGFQAPANRQTFEESLLPNDCHPQSAVFEHHNKQVEGPERLIRFQAAHHRVSTDFDGFIYKSQLVQAEALKCAVEHWRRRKFKTAGALFWQINDCWPVSSWAVIDSALRPKAAYYFAKKFYDPVLVSFKKLNDTVEVYLTNDRLTRISGTLRITLRSFDGEWRWSKKQSVKVPANASKPLFTIDSHQYDSCDKSTHYLHAQFFVDDGLVSENRFFFEEPKRLRLPPAHVSVIVKTGNDATRRLLVTADRFVKYLRLEVDGEDVLFSDNYFDLDAGGKKEIQVLSRLGAEELRRKIQLTWLT